jgi:hypothetical protein
MRETAAEQISQQRSGLDSDTDLGGHLVDVNMKANPATATTWAFGAENARTHADNEFWDENQLIRSLGPVGIGSVKKTAAPKSKKKSKNTSETLNGT